ncbi:putative ABC transport system substrate-binding protein [Enhydrobacter aerosaccus]|uniref:Putative ABC transport system substrate-binding protein n=1 Tax=Enhydrobacter aerosaccus TaxID=225324 RepID=A0A1T4SQ11_9HYPH|nr:ABC transporter substrate-binding protein [Enhydrobacter aerosaccus]SKA30350.1 putative ABC transport system substrate-binding protein [Enhydrobacter aerosaccus]
MRRREVLGLGVAAAVLPRVASAQARVYRVGFLTLEPSETAALLLEPLRALGYAEGKTLAFDYRSAAGDPVRLPALAEELVRLHPDVLVAGWGTLAPKALRAATSTIPIVFSTAGDPVGAGLVQTLARPGGNVTGLSGQSAEFKSKQLQLLEMAVPNQRAIGVLYNPDTPYALLALKELQAGAEKDGIRLVLLEVRKPADFSAARLEALVAAGATSLFVLEDPLAVSLRKQVMAEVDRLRLPTMSGLREYLDEGALMLYGTNQGDRYRRTAMLVDRILKGANPAELPVEQPTKFDFIINLKAARALGVTIPPSVLALADDVIE